MLVIDDALLLAVLAGATPDLDDAIEHGQVFTTGCWYYRLVRAVQDDRLTGALSSAVAVLPPEGQARVLAGVHELPPQIGLLSLRKLVPLMGQLDVGRPLNLLTAEAVTAARVLEASVMVTTESPLLRHACAALRIDLAVTTV